MVSFRTLAAAAIAACAVPAFCQTTPTQVVSNIKMLTQKSEALQGPAKNLKLLDGALFFINEGNFPPIITGFVDIVSTGTKALDQMQGMSPVAAGPQSDAIFNAFKDFVRVHQLLLSYLIGGNGLFKTVPLIGAPVAAVLSAIEELVDALAFALIDAVQSRATDLQSQSKSLKTSVETAKSAYQGLSILSNVSPVSRVKRSMVAA